MFVVWVGAMIAAAPVSLALMAAVGVGLPFGTLALGATYLAIGAYLDRRVLYPRLARWLLAPSETTRAAVESARAFTSHARTERLTWLSRDALERGEFEVALELADRALASCRRSLIAPGADTAGLYRALALAARGQLTHARGEARLLSSKPIARGESAALGVELLGALAAGHIDEARCLAACVDAHAVVPIVAFAAELAIADPEDPGALRVELETPELRAFALVIAPTLSGRLLRA